MKPWERKYQAPKKAESSAPWEKEYSTMGEARQAHERSLQETEKAQTEAMREYMPDPEAALAGGLQGVSLEHADEIAKAAGFSGYKDWVERKRQESPVSFYTGEIAAPNPLQKIKGVGTLGKMAIEGAGFGHGVSEEELGSMERFKDAGAGALIGAGMYPVVKGAGWAGKQVFGEASEKQARAIGVSEATMKQKSEFAHIAEEEVMKDMNFFDEMNLFKWNNAEYNPKTFKFERVSGKSKIESIGSPSIKNISQRMKDAADKANSEINKVLDSKDVSPLSGSQFEVPSQVSQDDLVWRSIKGKSKEGGKIKEIRETLASPIEGTPVSKQGYLPVEAEGVYSASTLSSFDQGRLEDIRNMVQTVDPKVQKKVDDIFEKVKRELGMIGEDAQGATLKDLNEAKKRLYEELESSYKSLKYDPVEIKVKKEIARTLKDMVNEFSGSKLIKKNNEVLEKIYTYRGDVFNTMMRQKGTGHRAAQMSPFGSGLYIAGKYADMLTAPTRLARAKMGQVMGKIPKQVPEQLSTAPTKLGTQMIPEREEYITREPQGAMDSGNLQSQNLPIELVLAPLPRNSNEWIESKDFVYAKIAQHMPMMLEPVRQIIERHPEELSDFIAGLSQSHPEMFVKDKYNRVDGKVVDPVSREMAIKDIMGNEDFDSYDKVIRIQELNKTGVLNYE